MTAGHRTSVALRSLAALLTVGMFLGLAHSTAAQPANDRFVDAVDLTPALSLLPLGVTLKAAAVDNTGATTQANEPRGPVFTMFSTLWWKVVVPAGATGFAVSHECVYCVASVSRMRRCRRMASATAPSGPRLWGCRTSGLGRWLFCRCLPCCFPPVAFCAFVGTSISTVRRLAHNDDCFTDSNWSCTFLTSLALFNVEPGSTLYIQVGCARRNVGLWSEVCMLEFVRVLRCQGWDVARGSPRATVRTCSLRTRAGPVRAVLVTSTRLQSCAVLSV
jgi:hypothetical protein